MHCTRRGLFGGVIGLGSMRGLALSAQVASKSERTRLSMPGLYRGRVVAVENPASIVSNKYQAEPIKQMMRRGMTELTGGTWAEAWKQFFQPGDVVGVKVNPVGQTSGVISGPEAAEDYEGIQQGIEGYDRDHYMDMALVLPGYDIDNLTARRSYASKFITSQVNKVINLAVLKDHQSAGVTLCLKNLSHGMVNNVARSHGTVSANACGAFIPAVVSLPTIRNKVVLNIMDGIRGLYHGGPSGKPQFVWEHRTLYFGTDPVAIDTVGLQAIDAKRVAVGMKKTADDTPDQFDHFIHKQPEHIELAGAMGLGEFDEKKIDLRKIRI
jgi:uncharacterized protein (DUF362 family)